MNKRLILCGLVAIGLGLGIATSTPTIATDDSSPASEKTVRQLLERIERLEARVEQLENRRVVAVQPTTGTGFSPPQRSIPPDWSRHSINGLEYYIVPLQSPPVAIERSSSPE